MVGEEECEVKNERAGCKRQSASMSSWTSVHARGAHTRTRMDGVSARTSEQAQATRLASQQAERNGDAAQEVSSNLGSSWSAMRSDFPPKSNLSVPPLAPMISRRTRAKERRASDHARPPSSRHDSRQAQAAAHDASRCTSLKQADVERSPEQESLT